MKSSQLAVGLAVLALLTGCTVSPELREQQDEFSVVLELEKVTGVVFATAADTVQIDLDRPTDEVVETAFAVRDVFVDAAERLPELLLSDLTLFTVRPGDWEVLTSLTTDRLDDASLESLVISWVALVHLDVESASVRVTEYEPRNGTVVINEWRTDRPPSAVLASIADGLDAVPLPTESTELWVYLVEATVSIADGTRAPDGLGESLDGLRALDYIRYMIIQVTGEGTSVVLFTTDPIVPEQSSEVLGIFERLGLLDEMLTVSTSGPGTSGDLVLWGATP